MTFKEQLLGNLLTFQRGYDITKAEQTDGDVPIVSSSGVASFHNESKAGAPGVVIGRKGTLGTVHYMDRPYWPHDTTLWVKDFKGSHPRFLSYFLSTLRLENFDTGASNPTLNRNHLHKIKVIAPARNEQGKIAAVLAAYDDLIANNQRRIALLELMADEIYREWFVRMRIPGAPRGLSRVNPPEGWSFADLPHLASITYGFTFAGDRFSEVEVGKKIIRIRDVLAGDSKTYTDEAVDDKYMVKAGDLLIGMDGEFHMNHWIAEDAYLVQRTCRIAPKHGRLRAYLAHALKAPISHYQQTIVGATVGHLGAKHLNAIKLLVPPASMNARLELLNRLLDQRLLLAQQALQLAKTQDALLPRLISGRLRLDALDVKFPPSMQPPPQEAAQPAARAG